MVNKFLIGAGIVALVAVGSIGVLKLADDDGRRIGALGPIEEPIPLAWRGAWTEEAKYDVGQVVSYQESSYVAEAENVGQVPNPKDGPWALMAAKGLDGGQGPQGAQGPAGTFSGSFQSPDGRYTLSVTNTGIEARGPNGNLTLNNSGVTVRSGTTLVLDAGSTLDLKAAGNARLVGAAVSLGCASGARPVARLNDPVNGSLIIQGSPTVLAC